MTRNDNGFMVLKVDLLQTGIVRTISVPSSMTLEDLSDAIQSVMGWEHDHLWRFQDGQRGPIYELPHKDEFAFGKVLKLDASTTTLRKAFPRKGSKLTYEYDFGDSWDHLVTRMADPKVPEIACLASEGPDGIEDFGGQWRLAEFIAAMRKNPKDRVWSDVCEWSGFDDAERLNAYLAGESAAVKTEKLRRALAHVKVELPPKADMKKVPKMSDEEQAHALGVMFATGVPEEVWRILRDAFEHGGTCSFADPDKTISTYLLTVFDGLKITDGVSTPFITNPSKLKVHKKWVDWYAAHKEDWKLLRGPFDILESYARAAVRLYGAIDQVDLYELIKRYDPGLQLGFDETMRYLEARTLWSGLAYRREGKLFVDSVSFSLEHENVDEDIDALLKSQKNIDRWYPANREELFKWADYEEFEHTPEVTAVEMVLGSLCKLPKDELEKTVGTIHDLMANGVSPNGIYRSLVGAGFMERISTKPRQHLIDALDAWQENLHVQTLNGHTVRDLRAREAQKAAEPKISRNAPCPCGSGKKYKLCCGKGK